MAASSRPSWLRHGHTVLNPFLPKDDFDEAVKIAQDEFDRHRHDVILITTKTPYGI
jgi:hypothetical protein